ncbi:hypothetical protein [Lysinibacillus sp. FSL L8-0126]|uniref:hypothetical protein n=2 Tax=unclassified Lysinibacillus TaxID=2636778 RepID=UPI00315A1A7C
MKILKFFAVFITLLLLSSCEEPIVYKESEKEIDIIEINDVTNFTTDRQGDYLVFNLMDPVAEKGYIQEFNSNGEIIKRYEISDRLFAPSNIYFFQNKYYFASSGYSGDSKIMSYNPNNSKISFINTGQNDFVERFYMDDDSKFIMTNMDKNLDNKFCKIGLNKCIEFPENYRIHDITILEGAPIVVGIVKDAQENSEDILKIRKYNKDLEIIDEVNLNQYPNYFSFTGKNNKLYLFMYSGDIVEISSDLKVSTFSSDFSAIMDDIVNIEFKKNLMLENGDLLINIVLNAIDQKLNFIVKVSFSTGSPQMEIIENTANKNLLNVDYDANEFYTASYKEDKNVISIWDSKTLKIKNKFKLDSTYSVYLVDKIN